jgi:hypothetical protein
MIPVIVKLYESPSKAGGLLIRNYQTSLAVLKKQFPKEKRHMAL